jgi:two-component system cell cycle sensor histidine kinase/response regulator CckA
MNSVSPFGDIALKAKVADLSIRLAEAKEALNKLTAELQGADPVVDGQGPLLQDAQTRLAMERNLLRTLIDIVPDHIFVRDRSSKHLLNNHAQLSVLRVATLEDTIGKTDYDFYPPELAKVFHENNEKVMSSGIPMVDCEEMIPGAQGEAIWLSTTKVPLSDSDGNVIGLLGIARDITERKHAAQKMTEQAAMLDQAQDVILLLDLDNRITYMNGASERLLGLKPAEYLGKRSIELHPSQDHEQLLRASRETLGKGEWHGELHLHTRHGAEIFMDTRRTLILDPKGVPKAQLSISSNVTEKKRIETLALRNQRLESLGTLAGGIAHDLNNVLAPILMSIALLRLKVDDESGLRLLAMLEMNAERGAQLVRQVLAFGRGAEGQKTIVRPMKVAREIEQIVSDTFPKSILFEVESGPESWCVTGDPTQLHQVFLNLCVNARDAMPTGGTISLRIENMTLDESQVALNPGSKPGPYVAISVSDTGSGISKEIRDRIFEPFFTTKEIGKGTGLGLSTSMGIVQSHGGFITVASELGKGSTFKIHLPASAEPAALVFTPSEEPALPRGHNELILVVDDEEPILNVAKKTLERFGYRVVVATNGAAAVSLYALHRDTIAAVVTDMAMPIMDGPAMATALRAINPAIRIIGSSGLGASGDSSVAANAGVSDFIAKPYSAETLLNAIARVLTAGNSSEASARQNRPWV